MPPSHTPIVDCTTSAKRKRTVRRAADILRHGGLIGFPTETVYGVAAAVRSAEGLERLRKFKGRSTDKPFSVHLPEPAAVERYVDLDSQPVLRRLIGKTWPGPVTYVVQVDEAARQEKLRQLGLAKANESSLYHAGAIGLRCPDEAVASAMLAAVDGPVVASSANRAGEGEPHNAAQAARSLGPSAQMVLDGGASRFSQPSTVVRVVADQIEVLREGVYDRHYLEKQLTRTLLFVCSGNTCRSPMAVAIARMKLAERLTIQPDELERHHWQVGSAGVFAMHGAPASEPAVQVIGEMGGDLSAHRSRPLTPDLIEQAERVYCMTQAHRQAVMAMAPESADKVELLDERGELADPVGGTVAVYRQTARQIAAAMDRRLDDLM